MRMLLPKTVPGGLLWLLAVLVTLGSVFYQRATGPTNELAGQLECADGSVTWVLPRTATSGIDLPIAITAPEGLEASLHFRRYRSHDQWSSMPMQRHGDSLSCTLPWLDPAGKYMYRITLAGAAEEESLTETPVLVRFKGAVPAWVLLPHILLMFTAMLVANRCLLEAFTREGHAERYVGITLLLMLVGGMTFGPLVQYYAFGEFWTGVPFGWDLTDNKTLIATLFWIWAWWSNRGTRSSRVSILLAGLVTLVIFAIPHSVLGSELDYTAMENAG